MAATNFAGSNDTFGIESTFSTSDDIYDMIDAGGSPNSNPEEIKTITAKDETKLTSPEDEVDSPIDTAPPSDPDGYDPLDEDEEDGDEEVVPAKKEKGKANVTDEDADDEDDDTPAESNIYKAYAEDLKNMGFFTELLDGQEEPDMESPEGLQQRLNMEMANRANNFLWNNLLGTQGEEGQRMFQAVFVNKVPINTYLEAFNKLESVKGLDIEESEENQEKVVRTYYASKNKNSEFIDKKIQKLKDLGELEDTAKEYHEDLVASEESRLEALEQKAEMAEAARKETEAQYQLNLQTIFTEKIKSKDFGGLPITEKSAMEAYSELTQPRYKLNDGSTLTEFDKWVLDLRRPENHEQKAWLWMMKKQREKDPTLAAIKKKGVAEAITENKLFQNAERNKKNSVKKNGLPTTRFADI